MLSRESKFEKVIFVVNTAHPEVLDGSCDFLMTDWDKDGKPDLVSILRKGSTSHTVGIAVSIWSESF